MDDSSIIRLYWARDSRAIAETARIYGAYCASIARNILESREDAEECVNDTWLRAWNAIPPRSPNPLAPFLGAVTRNLAFDRWQARRAEKRGGGETALALDELGDCVSGREDVDRALDARELEEAIRDFLGTISREKRAIFLRRYWYAEPVGAIAARLGRSENSISAILLRTRKKLRDYLTERGFDP